MIYSREELQEKFNLGQYPTQKLAYLHKTKKLFALGTGAYSDDPDHDKETAAAWIRYPSYLSFEYALSFHGLIPEKVYEYTCAGYNLPKPVCIENDLGRYSYRNTPPRAFWFGVSVRNKVVMASPEKALLDMLHVIPSVRSLKALRALLFEDLRIDEIAFDGLDKRQLIHLSEYYPGYTFIVLRRFLKKEIKNGRSYFTDGELVSYPYPRG